MKSTIHTQTHICHIVTRNFLSLKKYFVKSSLVIHLVKMLLSRNFCQKSVRENFHTLYSHSVTLHRLISRKFFENTYKASTYTLEVSTLCCKGQGGQILQMKIFRENNLHLSDHCSFHETFSKHRICGRNFWHCENR